jgi:hypothetical protein
VKRALHLLTALLMKDGRAVTDPAEIEAAKKALGLRHVEFEVGPDGDPGQVMHMVSPSARDLKRFRRNGYLELKSDDGFSLDAEDYNTGGYVGGYAGGGRASKLARAIATYRIPLIRTVEDHTPRWSEPEFMKEDAFDAAASKPFSRKELVLNIKELLEEAGLDPKLSRHIKATGIPDFLEFDSGNISHAGAHHEVDVEGPEDIINKLKAMLEGTDGDDPQMMLGLGAPLKKAGGGRVGAMKALMQRITGGYRDATPAPAVDLNIDDLMVEADQYLQGLRRKPRKQRTPEEQRELQQWGYGDEE